MPYLPCGIQSLLACMDPNGPLEEIRIRAERPLQLCFSGYERLLYGYGGKAAVTAEDCTELLHRLLDQSVYAWETELGNGFFTLPGGYRVGLSGRALLSGGMVERISEVSGFNIRIAREVPDAAASLLPSLLNGEGRLLSTLVVSPPGCGKTTLLRDIARCCSNGEWGARPTKVSVVDTRYELSGAVRGVPQLDVGLRTDVLSGVPKATGIRMMLTGLSPELIVTDELSTQEEAMAALEAAACGTAVAASAHGGSIGTFMRRSHMFRLLREGLFERIVLLGRNPVPGTVEQILTGGMEQLEVSSCCAPLPC